MIKFLTRPGCHLCDDARPLVLWAADRAGVGLVEIDIDGEDDLLGLYGLRIPVVLGPGDLVIAEGILSDRRGLLKEITKAGKA